MKGGQANQITADEMMVYAASKLFEDGEIALVGTGLPMIAAYLAKQTHAPNTTLIFESGIMDAEAKHMASGVGDFPLVNRAVKTSSLFDSLSLLQRGKISLGFLGAAEIDPFGNINSTIIGNYNDPKVRLPGSGGANDIASMAQRTVIMVKHQRRKFVEKLQYMTTPGFIEGPESREKYGLPGKGPQKVITDLGVFCFDKNSKRMVIESLHEGVTLEKVKSETGFNFDHIPIFIPTTEKPDTNILSIIRSLDPERIYINK
ncbi:3-oxoacid CoA-transferase [Alkalihalobacillus oceani]|uniref:CoA-transferase subunit beta n=1 Tax=Halalkalibacter oceani TaxID=1653776 RepID=UPI002040296D|nr:CoA-transferase [Halalkalibacter oceani]MCM3762141.1 3-oxoacid CoA-transferase [Halalkalibacter oceani]